MLAKLQKPHRLIIYPQPICTSVFPTQSSYLPVVQKRVTIANHPQKDLLARLAFSWYLGTWTSGGCPPPWLVSVSLPVRVIYMTKIIGANTCCHRSLGFCVFPGQKCPYYKPPIKTLGTNSLMSLQLTHVVMTCCWGRKRALCDFTGRGLLKAPRFFWTSFMHLFPLLILLLIHLLKKIIAVNTTVWWVLWTLLANHWS